MKTRGEGKSNHGARARAATVVLAALLLAAVGPPARALQVLPGQAFEVDFHFTGTPDVMGSDVDLLVFGLDAASSGTGVIGLDVELWDGATLLAQASTAAGDRLWGFVPSGSGWLANPVTTSDFSSVVDGSIDGQVRLIPQFDPGVPGARLDVVFNPPPGTGLDAGLVVSGGSAFVPSSPGPSVSDSRIASVPEPAAGVLALGGLVLLAHRR